VEVAEVELLVVSRCMDRRREADFVSKRAEASPPDLAATLATVDIGVLTTYVLRDSAVVMVGVVCTDNAKTHDAKSDATAGHMAAGATGTGGGTTRLGTSTAIEVVPVTRWSTVVDIQSAANSSSSGAVSWRGESGSTSFSTSRTRDPTQPESSSITSTGGTFTLPPEETGAAETATSVVAADEMSDNRSLPASGGKSFKLCVPQTPWDMELDR